MPELARRAESYAVSKIATRVLQKHCGRPRLLAGRASRLIDVWDGGTRSLRASEAIPLTCNRDPNSYVICPCSCSCFIAPSYHPSRPPNGTLSLESSLADSPLNLNLNLNLVSTMSDIAIILFGPKTTWSWFRRSTKKQSPHPLTAAHNISEPLLIARSVAVSPPTTSPPTARAGCSRLIPSIGASPSALHHHRSNKSRAASPFKTHLHTGSFEGRQFGSNSANPQPASLVDSSPQSKSLADAAVPRMTDSNDSPAPSVPALTPSSSMKHIQRKPPTTPIPPVPSLPSGSLPYQRTSKDPGPTRSGSTSASEAVDAKATTIETTALIPMVRGGPDRLPSLRRKPPPPLTATPPPPYTQWTESLPPPTASSAAATSLSSFTQEYRNPPDLSTAKDDCTWAGNVVGRKGTPRSPTRTPNVAPTVTALALPLLPTQTPSAPAKAVQEARQIAPGPAQQSRQRFHTPIGKPSRPSTAPTPTRQVPIDFLAPAPLPPRPSTSNGRSQSFLGSQKQPAALSTSTSTLTSTSRTTPYHRLKRPNRSRSATPLYQSFLPSFDVMEEPHRNTVPPLIRRSA